LFRSLTKYIDIFYDPGNNADCTFDDNYKVQGKGCNNFVLIMQDKEACPDDPDFTLVEEEAAE
jgi:hypothetical protein